MKNFDAMLKYGGSLAATRAGEKRGILLRWLWLWGLTDRHMVGKLLHVKKSATLRTVSAMLKLGLIAEARVMGLPTTVLYMTPAGATLVAPLMEAGGYADMQPLVYASKLNVRQAQHDLLIQRVVFDMVERHGEVDYVNDRMLRSDIRHHRGAAILQHSKLPDALVTLMAPDGEVQRWALEVYETLPPPEQRERIISCYAVAAMEDGELYGTIYASTQQSFLDAIERTAQGGCRRWTYDMADNIKNWRPVEDGDDPVTDAYWRSRAMLLPLQQYARSIYTTLIS